MSNAVPRVLSIAGTDPSGGAGIQADIKSITAAGGYAMNVTTCLVAQNTHGVRAIHTPEIAFLRQQLDAVSDDVAIDAVKTGMLGTAEMIAEITDWLNLHRPPVLVVDPVMVATSGDRLLTPDAEGAMREFCRLATVITPNIGELAVLTGSEPARTAEEALAQAQAWAEETGVDVVVKTGHLSGTWATNYWVSRGAEPVAVPSLRVDTTSTHGTGCSLSSALATRLAMGDEPTAALAWVTDWLHEAITHGAELNVGTGHGPVDHSHRARRLAAVADPRPWLSDADLSDCTDPEQIAPGAVQVDPVVAPVGPWTSALWRASADLALRIERNSFVAGLVSGGLSDERFRFYLGQDSLYLVEYARALAHLAVTAPNTPAMQFWAESAIGSAVTESALHEGYLGDQLPTHAGPVTENYRNFLVATTMTRDYVVGTAAVLPCYWLYAQVGGSVPEVADDHPYAEWLRTYNDPGFAALTRRALELVEEAMAAASPQARREALRAYLLASRHELEFFDQAMRLDTGATR